MSKRAVLTIALAAALMACSTTRVDDLAQYETVPMNKVYPYPSQEERAGLGARVTVARDDVAGMMAPAVDPAHDLIQLRLEEFLSGVGASMRTAGGAGSAAPEQSEFAPGPGTGSEAVESDGATAPDDSADSAGSDAAPDDPQSPARDFGLTVRVTRLDYSATWTDPTNWFFQSEEVMAEKPGTCTHHAIAAATFDVFSSTDRETPRAVLTLDHSGKEKTETLDQTCPFGDDEKQALFSRILDEALVCLRVPIENAFAPRGFILEERSRPEDDYHLFKTSLGLQEGMYESLPVNVLRVQHSTSADGRRYRAERKFATGVLTDQIGPGYSWIRVDVRAAAQSILEGDSVKSVYEESMTADLDPFGGCSKILTRE